MHQCLPYHMSRSLPLIGPKHLEQEVAKYNADGSKRMEMTYLKDTKEENDKAQDELEELVKYYIFVVYDAVQQAVFFDFNNTSTRVKHVYQQESPIEWNNQKDKWAPLIPTKFLPHFFANSLVIHATYLHMV